MRCHF